MKEESGNYLDFSPNHDFEKGSGRGGGRGGGEGRRGGGEGRRGGGEEGRRGGGEEGRRGGGEEGRRGNGLSFLIILMILLRLCIIGTKSYMDFPGKIFALFLSSFEFRFKKIK